MRRVESSRVSCIFPDGNTRISKLPTSIVNESIDLNVSRYRKEVSGILRVRYCTKVPIFVRYNIQH